MTLDELQKIIKHMELMPIAKKLGISWYQLRDLREGQFKNIRHQTVEKLITYFNLGK